MQTLDHYYTFLDYIYKLEVNEVFTLKDIEELIPCSRSQIRSCANNLMYSHFIYPYGNRGYCVNEIKLNFPREYKWKHEDDFTYFYCDHFEISFKTTNLFYTLDSRVIDTQKIRTDLTYLLSYMFVFIKDYRLWCESKIFVLEDGRLCYERHYMSIREHKIFLVCKYKSTEGCLIFGAA